VDDVLHSEDIVKDEVRSLNRLEQLYGCERISFSVPH
jgi:hypothetical protein